jgi:hypothetical protein
MLKKILPPTREEITEKWKGPNNERMGQVALCGREGAYRVLVRKPKVKRMLKRPSRRREEYIRIDLQSIGGGWCVLNLSGSGFR